jgi:HAD superfamily hydrolase (TIGR01509 family)
VIKAVIFDVDGVLIDSIDLVYKIRSRLLSSYGVNIADVPDPYGQEHKSSSAKILLGLVKEHTGVDIELDEFRARTISEVGDAMWSSGIVADEGLIDLLKDLKRNNIRLAVASAGAGQSVANKLDVLGITDYFEVIITGDDVEFHKPHPEAYDRAISSLALEPSECVVIEDSLAGVEAGHSAGANVIGFIKYSAGDAPDVNTKIVVDDWQLLDYSVISSIK